MIWEEVLCDKLKLDRETICIELSLRDVEWRNIGYIIWDILLEKDWIYNLDIGWTTSKIGHQGLWNEVTLCKCIKCIKLL